MGVMAVVGGYFIGNALLNFAGGAEINQVSSEPQENEFIITNIEDTEEPQVIDIPENDYTPESRSGSLFVVQLGAFNNRVNAERLQEELLEKGYPSVIITEGPPYKVQLRASQTEEEAEQLKKQVKNDGYVDVFIVH